MEGSSFLPGRTAAANYEYCLTETPGVSEGELTALIMSVLDGFPEARSAVVERVERVLGQAAEA